MDTYVCAVNGTRIVVIKWSLDGIFKSKNTAEGVNGTDCFGLPICLKIWNVHFEIPYMFGRNNHLTCVGLLGESLNASTFILVTH